MQRTIRQAVVSILLIFVAVPALAAMSAKGLSPSPGINDFTATSTVTLGTSYATSTVTRNDTIYASEQVFVKAVRGWEEELSFRANKGDTVYVKLSSNIVITFTVLGDTNHTKWVQAGYPSPETTSLKTFSPLIILPPSLETYVLSWTGKFVIPSDGKYWFMFFNYSDNTPAQVYLDATRSYAATTTLASTILSTILQSNSAPLSAVSVNSGLDLMAAGGILILLASVIVLAKRKRGLKKSAAESATASPTAKATAHEKFPAAAARAARVADETKKPKVKKSGALSKETSPILGLRICANCKAQLPAYAAYCDECGAAQA